MSYTQAKRKYEQSRDEQELPPLPCTDCRKQIARGILAQYGHKCSSCFELYCRTPQSAGPFVDKEAHGDRAWAHSLRARDSLRLSGAQRTMWRAALPAPKRESE